MTLAFKKKSYERNKNLGWPIFFWHVTGIKPFFFRPYVCRLQTWGVRLIYGL